MKKVAANIYGFCKDMSRHNSAAFAASVAFFFFMSLFPTLMFLFSLFTYLPLTPSDLIEVMDSFVPHSLMPTLATVIDELYSYSRSLLPLTVVATLWTANMGMMGLIRGLNGVLDIEDKRNYFILRGIATIYTVILLIALVFSLLLIGFGRRIVSTIYYEYPKVAEFLNTFLLFRSIILFVILTLVFALIYTFLPAKKQRFMSSLPGAVVAALGWIVATFAYSIYINYFNGFSIYGNLTAIMILLFWMYMCFNILIAGAFLNKYYNASIENNYEKIRHKKLLRKEHKKEEKQKASPT